MAKLGRIRSRTRGEYGVRELYLDFRPVRRVWSNRGIRITDEATAQRPLNRIRDDVAEGGAVEVVLARYQPTNSPTNLVPTWLGRWIALRRRDADAGSLSPLYADELERLAAPGGHFSFFDRISFHEVSFGALEDWSLWLADRGLGPKSRHLYLGYFRTFWRWLERRGELPRVPHCPKVKVAEYEPNLISISDQDLVLAQIPEADRGIFLALAHLGLRPGEARALEVGDYHDGWISVDKAVKGKVVSSPVRGTKSGKPKRLPVSEEVQSWIERHVDQTGRLRRAPLFPNPRTGNRSPHKALYEVWKRAVRGAGLPPIALYEGTKHSFATDAIRRGVPERHLQRFLGHASAWALLDSKEGGAVCAGLPLPEQIFDRETNVPRDLAKENGRDVATLVKWHRSGAAVGMPELLVGAPLPHLLEAEGMKNPDHLTGLEDRRLGHS